MIRLLLVAVDYFPYRHSGDKNFWFDLLPLIVKKLDKVIVLSLNYDNNKYCHQEPGILIINIKPFRFMKNNALKCGVHWGYLERSFTFAYIQKHIQELIKKHDINIVHVPDNFGPVQYMIKGLRKKVAVTSSAISYHHRYPFYDVIFKTSYSNFDKIICYTNSIKNKLTSLGIDQKKLIVIQWGVEIPPINGDKAKIRREMGINESKCVFLWTGYTQQANYHDFYLTLESARTITKSVDNCHFLFAFKPENYKKEYAKYSCGSISILQGIKGKETLRAADILISPITSNNVIVAPPLTWLEVMSYGIPVVTTPSGGVHDVIEHGVNGFISTPDKLTEALISILGMENISRIREKARRTIENKFDITTISEQYINTWQELFNGRNSI